MLDITDVLTGAVATGVVHSMRRGTLKAVTADVRSTLSASPSAVRTPEEDVMGKLVTGEARAGRCERGGAMPDDERSEADSVSEGDVPEGGEPSETAQRTCRQVRWRSRAAKASTAVGTAVKLPCYDRPHRHVDWRCRRRRRRVGADIAVMVGGMVNRKGITGNDDDAKPARTTRT